MMMLGSPKRDTSGLDARLAARVKIGIITAQFNATYTASLERHCLTALKASGIPEKNLTVVHVPGSLEIPVVAKRLALSERYDVIIALGVVIKGETYHFELVANESAHGCQQVALDTGVPVIMEILACSTEAQAAARCGDDERNKGREAAAAAIAMLNLMPKLG